MSELADDMDDKFNSIDVKYELFAVCTFMDDMDNYAAVVKRNRDDDKWTRYHWDNITDMDESYLDDVMPHILFYQRVCTVERVSSSESES